MPSGSPGGSVLAAGNVVLSRIAFPSASLAVRSATETCAFGPAASSVQSYAVPEAKNAAAASSGAIPAGYSPGRQAVIQSGCLGCHRIGTEGNAGPGPGLSDIGARLSRSQILTALVNTTAPMPSFRNLPPGKLRALVIYLSGLRTSPSAQADG